MALTNDMVQVNVRKDEKITYIGIIIINLLIKSNGLVIKIK